MNPVIVQTERKMTAVVKAVAPFSKLPEVQRASRATLGTVVPSLDVGAIGRTCTRWTPPVDGALPMEIGTIVSKSFAPKGNVVPSDLPAGRAAHLAMKGSFENLPKAWDTLFAWCTAQGLAPAGINWEVYGASEDADLYALLK
jgi:effector-binding domain-containing protein